MLFSLLPGLRELRTPLSSGYLWLIDVWLVVGDRLPRKQPVTGTFAPLWRLGSYFDRAGLVVAASFAAYMVGSFVEIDPLKMWEHGGRPGWLTGVRNLLRRGQFLSRVQVFPMSIQAGKDLTAFSRNDLGVEDLGYSSAMNLMVGVMQEEQQIATRLHATNTALFDKYDRLLAESAFRLNVAFPLTLLLVLLVWMSHVATPWKALLFLGALLYGSLLFRQAATRAIQSRDVIVQALVVGVVESRTVAQLRPTSHSDGDQHADAA